MNRSSRAPSRALITAGLTAVAAALGWLATAPVATAHVHVDAVDPAPGESTVLMFQVPGESKTGALTTELTVTLPGISPARTELMPGWTARLDRDSAAGTVRSVTWTADPSVGISPDQFAVFRVLLTLPAGGPVSFPATQTYSDGTVVRWDQPPLADGGEPEHPAPVLTVAVSAAAHTEDRAAAAPSDTTARWLGGGGLLLGAAGVAVAGLALRRS